MLIKRIEEAALNAWPAFQQHLYDGWILRFSKGYTKRANSVNPMDNSTIDLAEKVAFCQQVYWDQGLPAIFRMTPFAPPELDTYLEQLGYQKVDPSLVMILDLQECDLPPAADIHDDSLDEWLVTFCRLKDTPLEKHVTHREMLQNILARRFFASLADNGQAVVCGLGVLEREYFGLFDLVTDPQWRNQGYAAQLVSGLLHWAKANGARYAYLQVEERNAPARHLYGDKVGYQVLYGYWYRVRQTV